MKFVSTRKGFEATSAESVFQGLAPDGGLYVPSSVKADASLYIIFVYFPGSSRDFSGEKTYSENETKKAAQTCGLSFGERFKQGV